MSLIDNINSVAFSTSYDIDKIVGVEEGSFTPSADTTTRSDGFGSSIEVYPISHNFTRPVFTDLLWSEDNVTFIDSGTGRASNTGEYSTSFSDASNVYVATSKTTGTVYYKIIMFWINDYDSTNPSVEPLVIPNKSINFDSRENYQKIVLQDELSFTPSTDSQTVLHGLNRELDFRVFFESVSNEVWPLHAGGISNPFLYDISDQKELEADITTTSLNLDMTFGGGGGTARAWYRIYGDS